MNAGVNETATPLRQGLIHRWQIFLQASLFGFIVSGGWMAIAQGQTPIPAADGTGTRVNQTGNTFTISGGTPAGSNLFHSFQQFGLSQSQIANFLSHPAIANILARVTGGDPSLINGLIQVTGGNTNLYLINPAGIIFAANASLNLPAAFTATTASGIGFNNDAWFSAVGSNDYARLTGSPQSFAFTPSQPGSIVNAGHLAVGAGQSLTLLGGTVINSGSLTAPGGTIAIAAVPGETWVRLSQSGSLLHLEFLPLPSNLPNRLPFTPLALPALLTGGALGNATGLTVNPDGTVQLTGSTLPLPTTAGTAIVAGRLNAAVSTGTATGGTIQVLGDRVALLSANLDVSSPANAGNIFIGGDYQGQGSLATAQVTVVSPDAILRADSLQQGNGGRVIVWAEDSTRFFGTISARGGALGGNGGFVETSGKHSLQVTGSTVRVDAPQGMPGTWLLDPRNVLIGDFAPPGFTFFLPGGLFDPIVDEAIVNLPDLLEALQTGSEIEIITGITGFQEGNIVLLDPLVLTDAVGSPSLILRAANNIVLNAPVATDTFSTLDLGLAAGGSITLRSPVDTGGGKLRINSGGDVTATAAITTSGGDIRGISGGNFTASTISTNGGNIDVDSGGNFTASAISTNSGNLQIKTRGDFTTGRIATEGGVFQAISGGNFTASTIHTGSSYAGVSGGDLTIDSGGTITTGALVTAQGRDTASLLEAPSGGGNVLLVATRGIEVDSIDTRAPVSGVGGDLEIQTPGRFRAVGTFFDDTTGLVASISTSGADGGGSIVIKHGGDRLNIPFVVGNASVNGTAGAITTGTTNSIAAVPPKVFFGNFIQGNIQILTDRDSFNEWEQLEDDLEFDDEFPDLVETSDTEVDAIETETADLEEEYTDEFDTYLDLPEDVAIPKDPEAVLSTVQSITGVKPALLYLRFAPARVATRNRAIAIAASPANSSNPSNLPDETAATSDVQWQMDAQGLSTDWLTENAPTDARTAQDTDQLEMILVTADGKPLRRPVAGASRQRVMAVARQFLQEITDPRKVRTTSYLPTAQQLYRWLIAPIEAELVTKEIRNLAVIADTGLRFLPLAALHDGKQFLVEKYSLGLMPSLSLTDTKFISLKQSRVLAMGASQFKEQAPLPAVPTELAVITHDISQGRSFLNQDFTLSNLQSQRQQELIVHLATHGEFQPGAIGNSFIQLWDSRLRLEQLRQLGWNNPPVELLVLSACRTALGNDQAELGFAGFAIQSGIKSVLASLWYVSDEGTLGLMTEFYRQLQIAPIRSEALRQAQIAMLQGKVGIQNGQLRSSHGEVITLPPELVVNNRPLSHPYYWAAFTLIGSPW